MYRKSNKPSRRGAQQISAGALNDTAARAERIEHIEAGPGTTIDDAAGHITLGTDVPVKQRTIIEITGGSNPYAWKRVYRTGTQGTIADYADGEVSAPANGSNGWPAYERNNNAAVPAGTVVEATVNSFLNCLEFSFGIGNGCNQFTGLAVETAPDYILAIKNGCLCLVAVGTC